LYFLKHPLRKIITKGNRAWDSETREFGSLGVREGCQLYVDPGKGANSITKHYLTITNIFTKTIASNTIHFYRSFKGIQINFSQLNDRIILVQLRKEKLGLLIKSKNFS